MGFYYGMYLAVCLLLLLLFIRFISFAKSHIDDGKKNHIDLMLLFYFFLLLFLLLLLLFLQMINFLLDIPPFFRLYFSSIFFSFPLFFDIFFLFYFISFSLLLHVTTTVACYTRWRTLIALFSQLSFVT